MVSAVSAYRSAVDEKRGRHLLANRRISKNELVFNERPLLALQSLGNSLDGALCCKHCKSFLFCRDTHLALHSKDLTRDSIACNANIISCRGKCGEYFCSKKCESDAWNMHGHCFLCTGGITEDSGEEHPLLQFKVHAIQTNEIFLMVADWLTRVLCLRARNIQNYEKKGEKQAIYSLDAVLKPFCDFTMVPWWDVCSGIDHSNQHNGGYSDEEYDDMNEEGEQEHADLGETLRRLCSESAELLRGAVANCLDEMDSTDDTSTSQLNGASSQSLDVGALRRAFSECIESDLFTGEFVAKVIGSFEQNVIGIRARHPLCNDMLFGVAVDRECDVTASGRLFRRKHQRVLLKCLDESGLFEDDIDDGNEDASAGGDGVEDAICRRLLDLELSNGDEEVPSFDGGDDMDRLFTPLDGTAVFSLACKMNHSCAPNVLVRYRCGWGEHQPLVLQCIALRDIDEGEELCISYIRSDGSLEERREALQNYGFRCECSKCKEDSHVDNGRMHPQGADDGIDENSLFGSDSENGYEEDDLFGSDSDEGDAVSDSNNVRENTCSVDERCDSIALSDRIKDLFDCRQVLVETPFSVYGSALSFIIIDGSIILSKLEVLGSKCKHVLQITKILQGCIEGASQRHLRACGWYGQVGECATFGSLSTLSWPSNLVFVEAYACFAIAASLGFLYEGRFIDSARMLDKATVLTHLKRKIRKNDLFEYVFHHVLGCVPNSDTLIYSTDKISLMNGKVERLCLRKPMAMQITEMDTSDFVADWFTEDLLKASKPLVIRELACNWKAVTAWRDMGFFAQYGHRLVSLGVKCMLSSQNMNELITIQEFFELYMIKSHSIGYWTLDDTLRHSDSIACLSEVRLFEQFPELLRDFDKLSFLDEDVAHQQKLLICTGGLRTGLHYDSFENVFVQLVGAKYIRLYSSPEVCEFTAIEKKRYLIDCELDESIADTSSSPNVTYFETILHPGDAIYIPSGCWYYTRSLSSSISVNYFWWHQEEVPQLVYSP